jgi:hypothetical protein
MPKMSREELLARLTIAPGRRWLVARGEVLCDKCGQRYPFGTSHGCKFHPERKEP